MATAERQHLLDGVVDLKFGLLRPGFLGERPKTVDHVARPMGVPYDARGGVARRVKIGLVPVQPAQTGAGAGRDGGQGLVDLMGNGGD